MTLRVHAAITGDLDGVADGSTEGVTAIAMGNLTKRVSNLSALLVLDIETNTITVTPVWQVSADNSTFYDVHPPNDAALVSAGTGTAGADASVTRVVEAPDAVYGWPFARMAFKVGVTAGLVADTYSVTYRYRQLTMGEG